MNIELYEGQECHLYITLNDEFEVYGGTTKQQFTVTRVNDEYLVTIPGQTNSMCCDSRFDIFARRASTGQEWLVQSGKIILKSRRSPEPATALSCFEYHITKTLVESGESYGVMVMGIKGERGETGLSAYELVKQHGYTGTEAEFTDMLMTFEASAQKSVDAQIFAENCAVNSLKSAQDAEKSKTDVLNKLSEYENRVGYLFAISSHGEIMDGYAIGLDAIEHAGLGEAVGFIDDACVIALYRTLQPYSAKQIKEILDSHWKELVEGELFINVTLF